MADPFGQALRDEHRGEREHPLVDVDGDNVRKHPVELYFRAVERDDDLPWATEHLSGPLLELGSGVGRHALFFQEQYRTVATEVSDHLVDVMTDRGVGDARRVDMFELPAFETVFRSVFVRGTQVGLAGSVAGLRAFLQDLARVTTPRATAVLDAHDPTHERAPELFGYRPDPTPGLAYRVFHVEYRDTSGRTLLFRLFSPERLREATLDTPWRVTDLRHSRADAAHFQVALVRH
jgi:hypothetical protein